MTARMVILVSFAAAACTTARAETVQVLTRQTADVTSRWIASGRPARLLPDGWSIEGVEVSQASITLKLAGSDGAATSVVLARMGLGHGTNGKWFSVSLAGEPGHGLDGTVAVRIGLDLDRFFTNDPWTGVEARPTRTENESKRYLVHFPPWSVFLLGAANLVMLSAFIGWAVVSAFRSPGGKTVAGRRAASDT